MLNILVASSRTSLDYRLFEKRFVYRQIMAIYESKMSDLETKLSILTLIYRTCQCKFALVDLIKRHYLLIWLTNLLESNLSKSNQQAEISIFYKLIQIYILIWNQLGSNRIVKIDDKEEVVQPPLTFLNQMFILMKLFLAKLITNHSKINDLKYDFKPSKSDENSISLGRLVIKNFFKVKRQLTDNMKNFNLNLIKFESSDNLDNELNSLNENNSFTYMDIVDRIEVRKRACSIDLNSSSKITRLN